MSREKTPFGPLNPEIGGIVHLDHVNFQTPDHEMATHFYLKGLGLTRDPHYRTDGSNMGVNVGMQQFHLPKRGDQTPPFPGVVGLIVPDIAGIRDRLKALENRGVFADTPYQWQEQNNTVSIVSPFGIRFRLHSGTGVPFLRPLGIAYVDIIIPPDTASRVAHFYQSILKAPTLVSRIDNEVCAVVNSGPFQQIRFIERELADYNTHSMHVSYNVTHYNQLRETLDSYEALLGTGQGEVFFFNKIIDPDNGETIFEFNNEVRSILHPEFMRPLVNRWPINNEPFLA